MKFIKPVLLFVLSSSMLSVYAQEKTKGNFLKNMLSADTTGIERNLLINAEVLENNKPLQYAKVRLYEQEKFKKVDITDSIGKFKHVIDFGSIYTLEFTKRRYVTKRLAIDTRDMPEEDKEIGYDLGKFKMNLIRYVDGMDTSAYAEPVAKYSFDALQKMFMVERKFTKKRQKALVKVEENNNTILEAKKAEFAGQDNEYDLMIRDADLELKDEDYELAKTYYRDALKIKPNATYPKEQLQKITKLSADKKENKKRYDLLVLQADNAFKAENYARAKEAYSSALNIFENEPYPKEQLEKISNIKIEEKPKAEAKPKKDPKEFKISAEDAKKSTGFMSDLAKKYPQGLTEELSEDGSKKITRRVIVNGNIGVEYKKIKHNWGGEYYFKNGSPINEYIWQKETE